MHQNNFSFQCEPHISPIEVDGQKLYTLNQKCISHLLSSDKNNWIEMGLGHYYFYLKVPLLQKMLENPNISLTIGFLHYNMLYFLYKYDNDTFRVWPDRVRCLVCAWSGYGINASATECYIGVPNNGIVINKLSKLKFVGCPCCGNELYLKNVVFTITSIA